MIKVIEFLTESHLGADGGYPYDHEWVGDVLAVAALNHKGGTQIRTYGRAELLAWRRRAKRYEKRHGSTFAEAMFETESVPV